MKFETLEKIKLGGATLTKRASHKAVVSSVALMTAFATITPAYATIDNTVTATGSSPGNVDDVTATADESVDVQDAAPVLLLTKSVQLPGGGAVPANAPEGTVVEYVFTVENTGNVTVTGVAVSELSFDGDSPINPAVSTGSTTLAPTETVTFTGTYTVTLGDIADQGGGDGTLDNNAEATGTAPDPAGGGATQTVTSNQDAASFDLEDANPSLDVLKLASAVNGAALADPDLANVQVGDVITYTYTVTNDGNVPVSAISLVDDVTAGTGADPVPALDGTTLVDNVPTGDSTDDALDNIFDVLGMGDSIQFTGTYTVTQDDVDTLQ